MNKTWCLGDLNSLFLARMEHLLGLYALPYDPQFPLVCFDERPCFLIGELIEPFHDGHLKKEHYAYEKNGSCALLAAIEPLTGKRLAQVLPQRTMKEYTEFCQALVACYPNALKIRLVQDNLNTHNASSFYRHLPAEEASMPRPAHCDDGTTGKRSADLSQTTERETDQNSLAVLA
ncbi:MAG: transposase [Acidobacteria bacterium]|nr:transposase [Acidobacteriota bacterium]